MTSQHVYLRSISKAERTSLSVIAAFIGSGSSVLDLGTGSGALGRYLRSNGGCTVDGVTFNAAEAELASKDYRQVVVADLEDPGWAHCFRGRTYDFIVCADVLEHLRRPEEVLKICESLLTPSGRVLISVPNAAYSGLVAELMQGEFRYRQEGLLDRTHLRFFTRRSLHRFLAQSGWVTEAIEAVARPLPESEFTTPFDQLPPAVSRYLLATPDATTYQFVVSARPGAVHAEASATEQQEPSQALFSAELFVGTEAGFDQAHKLVASGVIGAEKQVLRFTFPGAGSGVTKLRLDPADRPGFLRLHRISLRAQDQLLWHWRCDTDGLQVLQAAPHHDMEMRMPWPASDALVLLYGSDPRIELPIPASALAGCRTAEDVTLEVEMGWPMSADYLVLANIVEPLRLHLDRQTAELSRAREVDRQRQADLDHAKTSILDAQARIGQLDAQTIASSARITALEARENELASQTHQLTELNEQLTQGKQTVTQEKLALQTELATWKQEYDALATHLRWIENSTVFRATRPLVHAKMTLERWLGKRAPADPSPHIATPVQPGADTVDIIVPVYRGLADTQLCVRSVLASHCTTPWRLVLLNDASPEPEVTAWLREVATQDPRILLLENETNLGFVGTVNRGMALSESHDALLLNSDTEVANDWLDRLRRAAHSDARVASVTPFSNNATICSYPRFCEPNELPPGYGTAQLDALFASLHAGRVVDVPTGVGFCMYIRRDSLNALGLFDVENFGKGYGEENDFCCRAADAGWRNLHALDTFVLHTGGVSFGASKSKREQEAVEKLRRLHPRYDAQVHTYVTADPAWSARLAVDVARIRARQQPVVLAVFHNRGGGTSRHVTELADHLNDSATFFSLTPALNHGVSLELVEAGAGFKLEFSIANEWADLVHLLRALGVGHVHYHHVLGHDERVMRLGEELGVSWDFTAHDFYTMCPQISLTDASDRYCGEQGDGHCQHCSGPKLVADGLDIAAWRARYGNLLMHARNVLVPSKDAARRFVRMWPLRNVRFAPHTDVGSAHRLPPPQVSPLPQQARLRVAVLGALSRIKGADVLEEVATLSARQGQPVEFHLLGFAYRNLATQPRAALTVHGAYEEADLPRLLEWLKPDVVWFPAVWPETYSYTLSACLQAGLPVVAPDIGAFAERLNGRRWSWVAPWDTPAQGWVDLFVNLRQEHFLTGTAPAPTVFLEDAADGRIAAWSYESDYFAGIGAHITDEVSEKSLAQHRPGQARGLEDQARRTAKRAALSALVRLRSSQGLRRVARVIPQRWQRRVKSWLQA